MANTLMTPLILLADFDLINVRLTSTFPTCCIVSVIQPEMIINLALSPGAPPLASVQQEGQDCPGVTSSISLRGRQYLHIESKAGYNYRPSSHTQILCQWGR